jgi:hypothetical protein
MNTPVKLKSLSLMILVSLNLSPTPHYAAEGSCEGTAKACSEIQSGACTTQSGCFPNHGLEECAGTSLDCILIGIKRDCDRQSGCGWSR